MDISMDDIKLNLKVVVQITLNVVDKKLLGQCELRARSPV
jgi:hypothetical protein